MFQKILVPLDGTESAEGILPYVSQLARGLNAPLVLLSVIDPEDVNLPKPHLRRPGEPSVSPFVSTGYDIADVRMEPESSGETRYIRTEPVRPHTAEIVERVEAALKDYLNLIARRLSDEGVKAECAVAFGHPAEEIVQAVERQGCGLIAMSTASGDKARLGQLGNIAEKVAYTTHVPLLTIKPEKAAQYLGEARKLSRIMVPLDGSALAETALPYVEHLALKLSLEVELVRAVPLRPPEYVMNVFGYSKDEVRKAATDYLEEVARGLAAKEIEARWEVLNGTANGALVDMAQHMDEDLIVMTTRGHTGIKRWALGSVTAALVRSSGDPVLIIPPHNQANEELMR